eukprot:12211714-Alexandrium_andersonii.AAC.1
MRLRDERDAPVVEARGPPLAALDELKQGAEASKGSVGQEAQLGARPAVRPSSFAPTSPEGLPDGPR